MNTISKKILDVLESIKGSGSFVCKFKADFLFPNLEIEGFEELSFPINEFQAMGLISIAEKAPFGKGNKTIVDTNVRSAWEIDAEKLRFNGDEWLIFVNKSIELVKTNLGLEDYEVKANLYKLLVYKEGDFFLTHKDSEKEEGMFGTLIFGLPSKHTGGELIVEFDGKKEVIEFDKDCADGKIPFVAFYADCNHEVKPITSGYRVVLVYNLIHNKRASNIQPESFRFQTQKVKELLISNVEDVSKPMVFLLSHQYTPTNFSLDNLKLNDRAKANVLLQAAKDAGYYADLCLVTSCITGSGPYDDDTSEEIEEVFDEWIKIEGMQEIFNPSLDYLNVEEEDLIATFAIQDDEPLLIENEGYMGNYGPDITYWYHYGAVVLWSKKAHESLLEMQSVATQLKWLKFYSNKNYSISNVEMPLCNLILQNIYKNERTSSLEDYTSVVDWFVKLNNESLFNGFGLTLLEKCFNMIDASRWTEVLRIYGMKSFEKLIALVSADIDKHKLAAILKILQFYKEEETFREIGRKIFSALPNYLIKINEHLKPGKQIFKEQTLRNLLEIEGYYSQTDSWVEEVSNLIFLKADRDYVNNVLAKTLLDLTSVGILGVSLLRLVKNDLFSRVNHKPQPFNNFTRAMPDKKSYKRIWDVLEDFMISPIESVFDYRKAEFERRIMEDEITNSGVDLVFETIKKGSPYTLRINKTQRSYTIRLNMWQEDEFLLRKVENKLSGF